MRYVQTEYDRITDPIKRRYEQMSKAAGEKIIPLASGESPPKAETKTTKKRGKSNAQTGSLTR